MEKPDSKNVNHRLWRREVEPRIETLAKRKSEWVSAKSRIDILKLDEKRKKHTNKPALNIIIILCYSSFSSSYSSKKVHCESQARVKFEKIG
jgi:hypothetical protein